ncbi:hypothetical protein RRG08_013351 [Elysia crispata]|uniref:Uncharacterized protein n=1 Tax=Elysia crispata TaxID=231223 RepID=A0AAE1AZD7_9GAST|nr:hypothetical protein RRG08_013351 [Elysia crispata]
MRFLSSRQKYGGLETPDQGSAINLSLRLARGQRKMLCRHPSKLLQPRASIPLLQDTRLALPELCDHWIWTPSGLSHSVANKSVLESYTKS